MRLAEQRSVYTFLMTMADFGQPVLDLEQEAGGCQH